MRHFRRKATNAQYIVRMSKYVGRRVYVNGSVDVTPPNAPIVDVAKFREGNVTFDDSRAKKNGLYKFEVGDDKVIRGWSIGLQTMSLGEHAILHIPSSKAYGAEGIHDIPPNTDLVFEVELYRINGKGYYTKAEKESFSKRMKDWRERQLSKFDSNKIFAAKKTKKYGDRDAFEAYLSSKVEADVAEVKLHYSEPKEETGPSKKSDVIDTSDLDAIDD